MLLDFPRIVEDPDYLVLRLAPVLADRVDQARAFAAHAQVADPAALRVGTDIASPSDGAGPSGEELDRAAIVMRTHELKRERDHLAATGRELEREVGVTRRQLDEMEVRLDATERELANALALATRAASQLDSVLGSRSWRLTRPLRAIRRRK